MIDMANWLATLRDELCESVWDFLEFLALGVVIVLLAALGVASILCGCEDD